MANIVFSRGQRAGQRMTFTGHDSSKHCTFVVDFDALQRLDGSAADDFDPLEVLNRYWTEVTDAAARCFGQADDGAQVVLAYEMLISGAGT